MEGTILESKQIGHGEAIFPFVTFCHIMTHSFYRASQGLSRSHSQHAEPHKCIKRLQSHPLPLFHLDSDFHSGWLSLQVSPALVSSCLDLLFPTTACMEPLHSEKKYFRDLKTKSQQVYFVHICYMEHHMKWKWEEQKNDNNLILKLGWLIWSLSVPGAGVETCIWPEQFSWPVASAYAGMGLMHDFYVLPDSTRNGHSGPQSPLRLWVRRVFWLLI